MALTKLVLLLSSSNTININVNVTTAGNWSITTNTVNGYSFSGNGSFSSTGIQTVSLTGSGMPIASQTDNFTATSDAVGGNTTCTFEVTVTEPPAGTVTDPDGNIFQTVQIGDQVWMAENLKTTKYANGDAITNVTDNAAWAALTTEAYCWYNNDEVTYKNPYGALYNWYVVTDARNVCPTNWHVPTDAEWTTLSDYLGGADVAGGKLKEIGTVHWTGSNIGATNESAFTALPGGLRNYSDGLFSQIGDFSGFWTSTGNAAYAKYKEINRGHSDLYSYMVNPKVGFSVRCIKDNQTSQTINAPTGLNTTAISSSQIDLSWTDNSDNETGFEVWRSLSSGTGFTAIYTTDANVTSYSDNNLDANTQYFYKVRALNASGESDLTNESNETTFLGSSPSTVTDIDGNVYQTVQIGDQVWMAENLKTTRYPDGTAIPHVTDNTTWANLADNNIDDAYSYYNNDPNSEYGALYTWAAAMGDNATSSGLNPSGVQGVCPDGWHMPSGHLLSTAEWTELNDNLGGYQVAGGKLKETGTAHWSSPNTGATNESGFTALPGGVRMYDGYFFGIGRWGYWWSASDDHENASEAYYRALGYQESELSAARHYKSMGFSVRCVKD